MTTHVRHRRLGRRPPSCSCYYYYSATCRKSSPLALITYRSRWSRSTINQSIKNSQSKQLPCLSVDIDTSSSASARLLSLSTCVGAVPIFFCNCCEREPPSDGTYRKGPIAHLCIGVAKIFPKNHNYNRVVTSRSCNGCPKVILAMLPSKISF